MEVSINKDNRKAFSPEEVSAMILTKMKETAEVRRVMPGNQYYPIPRVDILVPFTALYHRVHCKGPYQRHPPNQGTPSPETHPKSRIQKTRKN